MRFWSCCNEFAHMDCYFANAGAARDWRQFAATPIPAETSFSTSTPTAAAAAAGEG